EMQGRRRNGDAVKIVADILMRENLAAHRINKEFNPVPGILHGGFLTEIRFYVGQHKLLGNIDGFYRNVEQFAKQEVNDTINYGIPSFCFDELIYKKFFGMLITDFCSLQVIITIQDTGEHVYLLQRCQITVELEPYIPAKLFHFLQHRTGAEIRILELGNEQGGCEQILITASFPALEIFCQVAVVQAMDEHFNPFLDGCLNGVLPKIFQVGNDTPAVTDDAVADGGKHFLIRIIDEMK